MEEAERDGGELMATELAKAYVQIIPSAKGIKGGIQESLGGEADAAGKSAGGKITSAIKGVIATAAIGKTIGMALKEGAALEQSLGGVETLFKNSADKVKANAAEAYRTAGMSANQYMELTTSFAASLLQSLGGDAKKAADISDMAMTDMSDNANKMGTDMERITDAYQGFAKQNYTMLDNLKLGYGGTKTEMQRLLKDAQAITGVKYDISNLSDVYSAIHVIQGELGITGTTAKEAAETLSGSLASMKAAFQNVLANLILGMDVGPALNALAKTVTTFLVGNLLPAVWNVLSALPGALITFIQALGPQMVTAMSGLLSQIAAGFGDGGQIAAMVNNMITSIGDAIVTNAPIVFQAANNLIEQLRNGIATRLPLLMSQGAAMLTNIVNGILTNLPMLIKGAASVISNLVSALLSALPTILQTGSRMLINLVNGIIKNLPQIATAGAQAIVKLVTAIAQNLPKILQSGITIIGQLAAGLVRAIPTLVGKIPKIIRGITNAFKSTDWGSIGRNIISGIAKGLSSAGGALWDAVKGVLGNFKKKVLAFFGIKSPARWGIYVGEMVDAGIAGGLDKGRNAIARAVQDVQGEVKGPFSSNTDLYMNRYRGVSSDGATELITRIQELIDAIRNGSGRPVEVSISLKDREILRVLRELGVAFE